MCNPPKEDNNASKSKAEVDTVENLKSLTLKASLLYANNDFEEALSTYNRLIRLDSSVGEFYYNRGYSLVQLNRHAEAVRDYLKSAELNYKRFEAYKSLGLIYGLVLNNKPKGIDYLNKCIEIKPDDEKIKKLINALKNQPKLPHESI